MKKSKGPRIGVGILLMLMSIASIANSGSNPPVGTFEKAGYYTFSFVIFVAGVWLIFRKGSRQEGA